MSTLERMSHHTSDETVHNRESFIILQPDESKTLVRVLSVDNLDSNDLRHDKKILRRTLNAESGSRNSKETIT